MTQAVPIPLEGLNLDALATHLRRLGTDLAGDLSGTLVSGGKSNLTFSVTDGAQRWILRRPPLGDLLPGAHDMSREYRVMSALDGTGVPVPRMVDLCSDPTVLGAPFYVMEEVEGTVVRTQEQAGALSESVRGVVGTSLVDALVSLHELDIGAVGLGDLGHPSGYLERQIARWNRQLERIRVRDLAHVAEVSDVLRRCMPMSQHAAVVHGDYRLDNVIVALEPSAHIAAVLDWELATLGDPLADLGTLLMFWDEPGRPFNPITDGLMALPGFPTRDEVIEHYVARRSLQLDDLDWYLVFAEFKLAIILEQIHARHRAGDTRGDGFEGVADMVVSLLASARERIDASSNLR